MWDLLIFGIAGVILVAMFVVVWKADARRRNALQAWADQRGWSYDDRDETIFENFEIEPFDKGHTRVATDLMSGTIGDRQAMVFGYEYTVTSPNGTKSNSVTYPFRVFAVSMPGAVGQFSVKPEGLIAKLGNKLGFTDVQLESEAFNDAFQLHASSQKLAYDLVSARNIELLLQHSNVDLRTEGDLLVAVEDGRLAVSEIDDQLDVLTAFIDNVPPFVWKDHGARLATDEPPAS